MDQLKLIHAIGIISFNGAHTFATLVDALGKCDDFLFVFPKEDKRKWNEEAADHEAANAPRVIIFETTFVRGRGRI